MTASGGRPQQCVVHAQRLPARMSMHMPTHAHVYTRTQVRLSDAAVRSASLLEAAAHPLLTAILGQTDFLLKKYEPERADGGTVRAEPVDGHDGAHQRTTLCFEGSSLYIVMAQIVMAYVVMAFAVMAYLVYGLCSSYGLYSHGLHCYGLYSYGLCSHGLYYCYY